MAGKAQDRVWYLSLDLRIEIVLSRAYDYAFLYTFCLFQTPVPLVARLRNEFGLSDLEMSVYAEIICGIYIRRYDY